MDGRETTPSSAASGPEEGFLQANSPKDLYTVECDGDLYFDMEEGVLVFMKNVRVRNPGLSMDCADHLKIYAEFVPKKPGDKNPPTSKRKRGKKKITLRWLFPTEAISTTIPLKRLRLPEM